MGAILVCGSVIRVHATGESYAPSLNSDREAFFIN